ncbi:MAG TPA: ferrochelatase, partial [Chromatiales bacterium]|nr:ferrochelatase [Chromatiales bacterium]
ADPRVVELPRALWLPLLHAVILPLRAPRVARLYRAIWTPEGPPLRVLSERLAARLGERLAAATGEEVPVALAMRYGAPPVEARLAALERAGAGRIVALPLYPQAAASTTGSAADAVCAALRRRRAFPHLALAAGYHDHPAYIEALAASVRAHWQAHGRGERLLVSFHGLPMSQVAAGDRYPERCARTAALLAASLGLGDDEWALAYQSRFGPARWLEPATDRLLAEWARAGVRTADVICPGFAVDCLETLEEIAVQAAAAFRAAGGEALRYVPALNDSPAHAEALAAVLAPWLKGRSGR